MASGNDRLKVKTVPMVELQRALDTESYEWLSANHPTLLKALECEVVAGRTPEQIKRFVLRQTGRFEIALRCEQVARCIFANAEIG